MALLQQLVGFTLRQVIGDAAEDVNSAAVEIGEAVGGVGGRVLKVVGNHFRDHSHTLPRALKRANDKSWHALGVALGGNGLFDWLKRQFASGDDKGLRKQVDEFLKCDAASFPGTSDQFRKDCLKEYQRAGKAGLFRMDAVDPGAAAQQVANFDRYTNTPALIQRTNAVMDRVADQLAESYPNLAQLLRLPTPDGIPLVAAAFSYFFRREVETDDELANGLFFEYLRRLTATQAKAFAAMMDRLRDIADGVQRTEENTEEIIGLLKHFKKGVSYDNEQEQAFLLQQREKFRRLPRESQKAADWSAMADRLGEAGLYGQAQEEHNNAAAAALQENNQELAAAEHFKAYLSACEKQQWAAALASIQAAAKLDERFELFPLHRYLPKRILGAGGFGTVFLCDDLDMGGEVAIKAIHNHATDLDRNVGKVLQEAHTLKALVHPGIIGVRDGTYADRARTRPYIVMDYFQGLSITPFGFGAALQPRPV
jgi:hypothetical protein